MVCNDPLPYDYAIGVDDQYLITLLFSYILLSNYRGVGCIFVEMLSGKPLFPGIKGVYDQLNKIWNVSEMCLYNYYRSHIPTNNHLVTID